MAANTIGSAISDIIAPAVRKERPKTAPPAAVNDIQLKIPCWKRTRPKSASTMSGVPAMISIPESISRASHTGRPYSTIHVAAPIAIGVAITIPIRVIRIVPISGSKKPPLCDWSRSAVGWLTRSAGRTYWSPLKAMNATMPIPIAQRVRPAAHITTYPIRSVSRHVRIDSLTRFFFFGAFGVPGLRGSGSGGSADGRAPGRVGVAIRNAFRTSSAAVWRSSFQARGRMPRRAEPEPLRRGSPASQVR
uniref:Unannotated protein n=1 Tax=freshwater metagenome TaxID=449393 RepID=A0A6J5Z5E9_9ZZZZ